MILSIAVALAGGLFASDAQARGGGGGSHEGGHISGFHGMHIPGEAGSGLQSVKSLVILKRYGAHVVCPELGTRYPVAA